MQNIALVELIVALLLGAVALGWVARKLHIPYPILLTLGGATLGFIPHLPTVQFDPNLVLVIFLPPILYWAGILTSWRDFKANLRPISLLAVGLVIVTTLAVGFAAKWLVPSMPWAVAFALGAIVSPPDAVAATAVLARLSVPRRVEIILEGESLVNDATGLVLYKFAVAAALTGMFSMTAAAAQFALVALGGIAIGLVIARLSVEIHRRLQDVVMEITLSLVLPFVAYLVAEALHVSGVLAVVAHALLRTRFARETFSPQARIYAYSVWTIIVFLLNSLIFILIGLQLSGIIGRLPGYQLSKLLADGAIISVVAIGVRFLWVFPATYIPRLISARLRARDPLPSWRAVTIVAWCGMRGIVSLAAALALPLTIEDGSAFPQRDLVVFLSFAVIFSTLVIQGLTLGPLINWLGVSVDTRGHSEGARAREQLARIALVRIELTAKEHGIAPDIAEHVREEYRFKLRQAQPSQLVLTDEADHLRLLRRAALHAQRQELLRLWRSEKIGDEVVQELERELDYAESQLE